LFFWEKRRLAKEGTEKKNEGGRNQTKKNPRNRPKCCLSEIDEKATPRIIERSEMWGDIGHSSISRTSNVEARGGGRYIE